MYNLILIATQTFLGQYASLDSCNKAIRAIYTREVIPYPELVSKDQMPALNETINLLVKDQRKYVCTKV